jgi:UDP-4-amino-4,6-dideoxy-N-acetyl-beta-L-altrosamine transaminase
MSKPIPYGKQNITEEDIKSVIDVLKSDFLTQGPEIEHFEIAFSEYIESKYTVAVSNGTAALHLAALALGVKENSNVITTPITFAASANCVRYCGGNVFFCDIDPNTYVLDTQKLEMLILSKPKGFFAGIIPVDFAGFAVDLETVRAIADRHGLWIIEDACHAPGGYFVDKSGVKQSCGNCNYADISIFSFHPVKHIAMGEGGAITTNNPELYQKLKVLRSHGIVRDQNVFKNPYEIASGNKNSESYGAWYYEMQTLGYNYRLTDFQAALGTSQLKRAVQGLQRRKEIAKKYSEAFSMHPSIFSQSGNQPGHAYHLYVINIENRDQLFITLRSANVFAQIHYFPVHLMPYYQEIGWQTGDFPLSEEYYSRCISLPMYPTLTNEEQDKVIEIILAHR